MNTRQNDITPDELKHYKERASMITRQAQPTQGRLYKLSNNGWLMRGYKQLWVMRDGKRTRMPEQRYIMEIELGRALEPWELVHHKDGNPENNALENLEVLTWPEHAVHHNTGSETPYRTRKTLEAMANMREEIKRLRANSDELLALEWGAYDSKGKLRALLESESEAYFYVQNRGHMYGGSYRAIAKAGRAE